MDGRRSAGPCEPEFAGGDEDGGNAYDRDHGFWGHFGGLRVDCVVVDHTADEGFAGDGYEAADADAQEGEAGESEGPAANIAEDDGIGGEAEV